MDNDVKSLIEDLEALEHVLKATGLPDHSACLKKAVEVINEYDRRILECGY